MLDQARHVTVTEAACPVCGVDAGHYCRDRSDDPKPLPEDTVHLGRLAALYTAAAQLGICASCRKPVEAWKPPAGQFSVQAFQALRTRGIDPLTGHGLECPRVQEPIEKVEVLEEQG